jgi:hypothetical protein
MIIVKVTATLKDFVIDIFAVVDGDANPSLIGEPLGTLGVTPLGLDGAAKGAVSVVCIWSKMFIKLDICDGFAPFASIARVEIESPVKLI